MFDPRMNPGHFPHQATTAAPDRVLEASKARSKLLNELNIGSSVAETSADDQHLSLREQFCAAARSAGVSSSDMMAAWAPVAELIDASARAWAEAASVRQVDLDSNTPAGSMLYWKKVREADRLLQAARAKALELIAAPQTPPAQSADPVSAQTQSRPAPQPSVFFHPHPIIRFVMFVGRWVNRLLVGAYLAGATRENPIAVAKRERPKLLDRLNELRDQFRTQATRAKLSTKEMEERWEAVFAAQKASVDQALESESVFRTASRMGLQEHTNRHNELFLLAHESLKQAIAHAEKALAELPATLTSKDEAVAPPEK